LIFKTKILNNIDFVYNQQENISISVTKNQNLTQYTN